MILQVLRQMPMKGSIRQKTPIPLGCCRCISSETNIIKKESWNAPAIRSGPTQAARYLSASSVKHDDTSNRILDLPTQFLRAMDASEFDPSTLQRKNVAINPNDGRVIPNADKLKPEISNHSFDATTGLYEIVWEDGLISRYSHQWVEQELSKWRGDKTEFNTRYLWADLTEDKVRTTDLSLTFQDAVLTDDGMTRALKALYQYGIVLVTNTPTDDNGAGVAALAAALGGGSIKDDNPTSLLSHYRTNHTRATILPTELPHGTDGPLRTLYGTVWSTASSYQADGASVADSAYGQEGLPLHTDATYLQDPPGLQIFTMVQPATKGGESVFGDGFAVAEELRSVNPKAFETLSNVVRRYRCMDTSTGWHLEAHGPVISVRNGQVVRIRHNDLDRLPDVPPIDNSSGSAQEFYDALTEAHAAWDEFLSMDKFRLVMALQPGDTMVVANQRCFHGRYSFETTPETPRAVIGCYMSQDELNSRFRREGFVLP